MRKIKINKLSIIALPYLLTKIDKLKFEVELEKEYSVANVTIYLKEIMLEAKDKFTELILDGIYITIETDDFLSIEI